MIKSVRLLNWRSHKDTLLEFRAGTNLLVGIMGAGKSSVMEAISFSLFGTFPALERRKLKLENIVRLNEPQAKVILEFVWGGVPYRAERIIERSKKGVTTHAEMYKEGSMVEHGPTGVTAYIQNLLGIDYDLFTRAIYSEQNNLDYFLNLGPMRRKEEMDVLLGLDRFETARANIVTVINRIRSKRQILEENFSTDLLSETEAKEKKLSEEHAALVESERKAAESYSTSSKEAQAASSRFVEMRKSKEAHERLAHEEVRFAAQLESLKKEIEGKSVDESALAKLEEALRSLSDAHRELEASRKALESRLSSLSKDSGSAEAGLKAAIEAKNRLEAAMAELSSALGGLDPQALAKRQKEAEGALLAAESERKSLERDITDLAESASRLHPGLSECPLCSSKLTDDGITHVKAEKDRLVSEKKTRMAALMRLISQSRKENDDLLTRLRRAALLGDKCQGLKKDASNAETLKAKKAEIEITLALAMDERKSLSGKADSQNRDAEMLRAQITEKKNLLKKCADAEMAAIKLGDVRLALAGVKFDERTYEEQGALAEKARIDAERALSSRKSLETQVRMVADMLALVRAEHAAMKKTADDMRSLLALEEQLAIFKNALLETQTSLRLNLADAINAAMNEVWPVFYPYRNYRALRLGVSEKDYIFEVDDGGGGWKGLETVASGGERACAALALRVALAMVLTPTLGWLILDEPTHNLDSEAVEMLSSALEFKVPEVVNQTFVITHDEAFMGSEFASSYRLSRDKEHNGETKAEAM
jgi:DNA repair protein SbcC/Rad50